jgi:hypothetical protein
MGKESSFTSAAIEIIDIAMIDKIITISIFPFYTNSSRR